MKAWAFILGCCLLLIAIILSTWISKSSIEDLGPRLTPKVEVKVQGKVTVYRTTVYCNGQPIEVVTDCANYPDEHACFQAHLRAIDAALDGCDELQKIFDKHKYDPKAHPPYTSK